MTEEQKNEPMTEEQINEIGNAIHDCISDLPYQKRLVILTTNMVVILNLGIRNGVWTNEEAVIIIKGLSDSMHGLLDNDIEVNQ